MKKPSKKRFAVLCNKLAVLASLQLEVLDEIGGDTEKYGRLHKANKEIISACEEVVDSIYQVQEIRTSTYLSDLNNKVDSVVRNNYDFPLEQVLDSEEMVTKLNGYAEEE